MHWSGLPCAPVARPCRQTDRVRAERGAGLAPDGRDVVRSGGQAPAISRARSHPPRSAGQVAVALCARQPDLGKPTPGGQARRVVLRRERMGHGHDVEAITRPAERARRPRWVGWAAALGAVDRHVLELPEPALVKRSFVHALTRPRPPPRSGSRQALLTRYAATWKSTAVLPRPIRLPAAPRIPRPPWRSSRQPPPRMVQGRSRWRSPSESARCTAAAARVGHGTAVSRK